MDPILAVSSYVSIKFQSALVTGEGRWLGNGANINQTGSEVAASKKFVIL